VVVAEDVTGQYYQQRKFCVHFGTQHETEQCILSACSSDLEELGLKSKKEK
jgi:hypothetical protein